jgi:NNP family nitrate/nitrite transporter-like MFS transporter
MWSVLVLFMGPEYHITAAAKFVLIGVPTVVGGLLRVPYALAVARFGGRNWTILSASLLLIPTTAAWFLMHPGTPYPVLLLVAALGGLGGGGFASSMANVNTFFPEARKGWALGLNAGAGNLGVAVLQLLALLIIATAGAAHPRLLIGIYLPLILAVTVLAATRMDNLPAARTGAAGFTEAIKESQTWVVSTLYLGSFGSFVGYSFAFGLVLQTQFARTPLQAATVTFIGPLLGSLIRPVGGTLADRFGGARVTFVNFIAMSAATGLVITVAALHSPAVFIAGFVALFALSGLGNGSTYKMIPAIFQGQARLAIAQGADPAQASARSRRVTGAVIGIAGAAGTLGGLLINLAFRQSYLATHSAVPALWSFLAFYTLCTAITYTVYLRPAPAPHALHPRLAYARI